MHYRRISFFERTYIVAWLRKAMDGVIWLVLKKNCTWQHAGWKVVLLNL